MSETKPTSFDYLQRTFDVADTAGMTAAVHEEGFALAPGILSADEISELRAAIDRLRPFGFDHQGVNEHYKCVFNRERAFFELIDRPGIVDLAEALMGEQCHIIGVTAWKSHPGHNGWGNHVDQLFVPVPESVFDLPDYKLPVYICTAHYYLNDIPTEEYCPTYVIPGSHKSGRSPQKGEEEWHGKKLTPVLVKAGDALFFRSEVWHTGSPNKSDTIRYLVQVHYAHRNIAQKFSPWPWQYNPEILAIANERQLKLLGKHPESNYG